MTTNTDREQDWDSSSKVLGSEFDTKEMVCLEVPLSFGVVGGVNSVDYGFDPSNYDVSISFLLYPEMTNLSYDTFIDKKIPKNRASGPLGAFFEEYTCYGTSLKFFKGMSQDNRIKQLFAPFFSSENKMNRSLRDIIVFYVDNVYFDKISTTLQEMDDQEAGEFSVFYNARPSTKIPMFERLLGYWIKSLESLMVNTLELCRWVERSGYLDRDVSVYKEDPNICSACNKTMTRRFTLSFGEGESKKEYLCSHYDRGYMEIKDDVIMSKPFIPKGFPKITIWNDDHSKIGPFVVHPTGMAFAHINMVHEHEHVSVIDVQPRYKLMFEGSVVTISAAVLDIVIRLFKAVRWIYGSNKHGGVLKGEYLNLITIPGGVFLNQVLLSLNANTPTYKYIEKIRNLYLYVLADMRLPAEVLKTPDLKDGVAVWEAVLGYDYSKVPLYVFVSRNIKELLFITDRLLNIIQLNKKHQRYFMKLICY